MEANMGAASRNRNVSGLIRLGCESCGECALQYGLDGRQHSGPVSLHVGLTKD